jgi:DNA polymerase/3'-5' exonuclease PolX
VGNREWALQVFAAASYLQARGANPYRVRAYQRAALRLLRMTEDASTYLDGNGELNLPGLGQRLRRKLGELVRTGRMSFHDELIAAEPRPIRTLMTVPGIGPRTADRLVEEAGVRGLKSLARAARTGRLQRLRGIGPAREQAWGEAASLLLTPPDANYLVKDTTGTAAEAVGSGGARRAEGVQLPLLPAEIGQSTAGSERRSGPERAA